MVHAMCCGCTYYVVAMRCVSARYASCMHILFMCKCMLCVMCAHAMHNICTCYAHALSMSSLQFFNTAG